MKFTTNKFSPKDVIRNETLFTVANGTLGFRGDTEENSYTYHKGTYINGFYDTEPIQYGETAYGYAKNHETILNLPDPKRIELLINNTEFSMKQQSSIKDFSLELDTNTGILTRNLVWNPSNSIDIKLRTERLVSFVHSNSAFIKYSIKNIATKTVNVSITSSINTNTNNISSKDDPRVGLKFSTTPLIISNENLNDSNLSFTAQTRNSNLVLAGNVHHEIICSSKKDVNIQRGQTCNDGITYIFDLNPEESVTVIKYITYVAGNKKKSKNVEELSLKENIELKNIGISILKDEQKKYLTEFWDSAQISIEGDSSSETALNFNLFQLLQSVGKNGKRSIAAKGLSGEGYEGHYFWDTEAYVCPFFTYTVPKIAENLLAYRTQTLQAAKERAKTMNLKGALFPWRTISGEETSAYFPAGTAQYHIDADIIFAMNRLLNEQGYFHNSTFDDFNSEQKEINIWTIKTDKLSEKDVKEISVETARMWMSLGFYNKNKDGKFCINEVTGPDEYTAIVNNNTYTNLMARENLYFSYKIAGNYVCKKEKEAWKNAADSMFIPYNAKLGIYLQDDSFLDRKPWNFKMTPKDNYPLLLHYHPLVIYRHRVLKQPDLVFVQFLLSGQFSRAEKIRNFYFYEQYTTGDSSLSHCIQSIMACETGNIGKALLYFYKTVRMDIDDVNGNVKDGIHTACMAGSWMSIVYGFGGFRDYNGKWLFNPQLPAKWKRLSFKLRLERHTLKVVFTRNIVKYSLCDKKNDSMKPLTFFHRNKKCYLNPAVSKYDSCKFDLTPKLKAVLFDLDGVITDTSILHFKAWLAISKRYNLKFNKEINKRLLGVSREKCLEIILNVNNISWTDSKKRKVCMEKNNIYLGSLNTLSSRNIFPGIKNLLVNLKTAGIKTAVASASKNALKVINKLDLLDLFTVIVDAQSVKMPKPEPDIFLAAADQINVWYKDCIGIEDSEAGIIAINKAGMKSIGITSSKFIVKPDAQINESSKLTFEFLKEQFINDTNT